MPKPTNGADDRPAYSYIPPGVSMSDVVDEAGRVTEYGARIMNENKLECAIVAPPKEVEVTFVDDDGTPQVAIAQAYGDAPDSVTIV